MAQPALRPLYRAAADLSLPGYLKAHPEVLDAAVVHAVDDDHARALEFGDLTSAALAADVAAALLTEMGDVAGAVERHLGMLHVLVETADTAEDLEALHAAALTAGARADQIGNGSGVIECWLLAAVSQVELARLRTGGLYPKEVRLAHLARGLRHAADVAELIATLPASTAAQHDVARFAALVSTATSMATQWQWPDREVLGVRALLRRLSRSTERALTSDVVEAAFADPVRAQEVRSGLLHLFGSFGD